MSWLDGAGAAFDPEEIWDPNRELAAADVGFTGPDIETDEQEIARQVFNRLAYLVPGWEAHDANPDTWLIEAFAAVAAELRALSRDVPDAIFVTHGTEVLGLPIRPPAPALGYSTWKAVDERGYTVRTGAQITLARTGDELVGFEVLAGAEIPAGETTVENVPIRAVEMGAAGNGLQGPAEVSDPFDWVESVVVTRPTTQGDDGQDRPMYLDQLSTLLRVVAFRPVLPGDYAVLGLTIPGVGRAVAMDGYNPLDGTWGHARRVCLVAWAADGRVLEDAVRAQVRAYLESIREVNFIVDVISPLFETVDVDFSVTMFGEQDPDVVHAICIDALEQELDPA
ncbi:MAG TPA: baseplate J/gp47 family protein, partial [Acidimicrobiia bacterium]|nr:baseplate J/gp47 family protein [Acidimicrobiia bacterium]